MLERVTHQALATRAIDLYTTLPWETLCAEVAKLNLSKSRAQLGHSTQNYTSFIGSMVEAAGVEPASENVPTADVYVCVRSFNFRSVNRWSATYLLT